MSKKIEIAEEEWKDKLNEDEFEVLRCEATERPFTSELLSEKRAGVYCCKACSAEIFNSDWKYNSMTGWPSFYDAIPGSVEFKTDTKFGAVRVEFHCANCGGHFGHLFEDGPKPTGQRFCTNGIALSFKPKG